MRGLVATRFDASVDVTGAVYGPRLRRVGRFHRSELGRVIDVCMWRFEGDSGSGISVCGVDDGRGILVDEGLESRVLLMRRVLNAGVIKSPGDCRVDILRIKR